MTTTPDQRRKGQRGAEPTADGAAGTAAGTAAEQRPPEQRAGEPHAVDAAAAEVRTPGPRRPAGAAPVPRPASVPRDLPRWVRWTVLPLLVLVPLGYVIISAQQSRESGESKQEEAAARHLRFGYYPSSLQQRVYQVPIPYGAAHVGYLETNSWDTAVLYTQFTTTAGGLDTFLAKVGTTRDALHAGASSITASQARAVNWNLSGTGPWSGITIRRAGDKPDHAIAVDLHDPDVPTVYVVSTVNFQHGFGGN
ncbi:hypothetical protein SAMN05216267_1014135 [Actinacidiphila rubida]|uniref:Uncharacterized protein n=1 Tax=Actinacidiphila rubida TaxID=310780 RepID=A0A1H8KXZ0_9ACTN|nr:hypothetical protein [Actinacidiphila rubida]SEN97810.1 hypothetical protein SAMN05216267_1014135 [Actinacidiphila rubida]